MGVVHAFGDINGNSCDATKQLHCDIYVKLFINDELIYRSPKKEDSLMYDIKYQYISKLIPKTSIIRIDVWDSDSGLFGSEDDLILRTQGDVNSFLQNPFRTGTTTKNASPNGQNSINTFVFWKDEIEHDTESV